MFWFDWKIINDNAELLSPLENKQHKPCSHQRKKLSACLVHEQEIPWKPHWPRFTWIWAPNVTIIHMMMNQNFTEKLPESVDFTCDSSNNVKKKKNTESLTDWAAKKLTFPPKRQIYLEISPQNTQNKCEWVSAHPGRLLWAGSSSRIQVPAVPLLVHRNKRYKKKEKESCVNEQLKESKTHSGRRLFLIDYSWLHKTKTL